MEDEEPVDPTTTADGAGLSVSAREASCVAMVGLKGLTGKKIIPIFIGVYNTSQGIFCCQLFLVALF